MKTVTIEQWERLTIEVEKQTDGPPLIRIEGVLHPAQAAQVCDAWPRRPALPLRCTSTTRWTMTARHQQLAMFDEPRGPQSATWAVVWGRRQPLEATVKRAVTTYYQSAGRLPAALRCAAVSWRTCAPPCASWSCTPWPSG